MAFNIFIQSITELLLIINIIQHSKLLI